MPWEIIRLNISGTAGGNNLELNIMGLSAIFFSQRCEIFPKNKIHINITTPCKQQSPNVTLTVHSDWVLG